MWRFEIASGTATREPLREGSAHGLASRHPRPFAAVYWDDGIFLQLGSRRWRLDDGASVALVSFGRLRSRYVIRDGNTEVRVTTSYSPGALFRRVIGTLYDQIEAEGDDLLFFVTSSLDDDWLDRVKVNWRLGV